MAAGPQSAPRGAGGVTPPSGPAPRLPGGADAPRSPGPRAGPACPVGPARPPSRGSGPRGSGSSSPAAHQADAPGSVSPPPVGRKRKMQDTDPGRSVAALALLFSGMQGLGAKRPRHGTTGAAAGSGPDALRGCAGGWAGEGRKRQGPPCAVSAKRRRALGELSGNARSPPPAQPLSPRGVGAAVELPLSPEAEGAQVATPKLRSRAPPHASACICPVIRFRRELEC
eukprot:TRINITY_DN11871_c0_g2_i1.p3 TRINITY_DN11871_c0_g2~~TRINITY_DN11871_c0_g2_i1.p3  ORF type:complete len:250 (+),score=47.90 TRINITY_DN11871_c0_g2_i1:71-751(+)